MTTTETIATQSGLPLEIASSATAGRVEVVFKSARAKPCVLHWGVRRAPNTDWKIPPASCWPADTRAAGKNAVQSPFVEGDGGMQLAVRFATPADFATLDFVLFFPDENRWDNNGGRNYQIVLPKPAHQETVSPLKVLRAQAGGDVAFECEFDVAGLGKLAVVVTKTRERCRVSLLTDISGNLFLHWGIAQRTANEWLAPPAAMLGPDTVLSGKSAAQTPFVWRDGFNSLSLEFAEAAAPRGISFVLKLSGDGERWLNFNGRNFFVPLQKPTPKSSASKPAAWLELADQIIHAEAEHNSWTLMHRFNLCHDLLDDAGADADGLALLYVWLRFSAIRQLTWQRNYNTKPRELAHAQDRLTRKFADLYKHEPAVRPLIRLMLVTVGRGGEGQQIRDEILNIMHRHHLKEVSGHFLEEWHQKLHNNTTPDDIVICEAYLEFLKSDGDLESFHKTLEAGGVTRERLESFERPIRTSPQFVPHLKDGLIHDFQHFLKILKASHSATDLETAINSTRNFLAVNLQATLDYVWNHRNDPNVPLTALVSCITEVRRGLPACFHDGRNLRELLYLDLALEQLLRGAVERNIHLRLSADQLTDLILHVLENVTLSYADAELSACFRHWQRLQAAPRSSAEWPLHATSVTERANRALAAWIDRFYQLFQPKAEYLGRGFEAESWTITLFSEEVVRGGSLGFVLSMLLHHLDPLLRQAAHVGDWQIISRGQGVGRIVVADSLRSLQRERFDTPTVVVADKVMGDEEIPAGVTAVIAPDVTDVVSHVAVRARNAGILFASCHDAATLQRLKAMKGQFLQLCVKPDGDIIVEELAAPAKMAAPLRQRPARAAKIEKKFEKHVLTLQNFNRKSVGGKSCNLARLRGKLPDWIRLPASVALPFGVFDHVLKLDVNQATAKRHQQLIRQLEKDSDEKMLAALRETVTALAAPAELQFALRDAMNLAGLPWPGDWEKVWMRIKQIWASKWNERAFLSRNHAGIPHESLFMAVLVQQVVPAEYAFVIHTVNPINGNPDELYAEVVAGLGETLVGNHPGRACRFVCHKKTGRPTLLAFPSKSAGLFGSGLIFRSDSNGEDLAGYAGAGLYDSVLLEPPAEKTLDYSQEPLVWDETFRRDLFNGILRIGLEVERACGSPQDIEGAVEQGNYYAVQTRPQVGLEKAK